MMEHALSKTVALADAELSPAEVPALIQELARNPSLMRALQVYMSVGRRRIGKVYDAKREDPVPQWLVDTVMHAPIEQATSRSANLISFGSAVLRRLKDKYTMPGWSLAAAGTAALAVVSAWLLVPNVSHGDTLLAAQLQRTIETTGSREAPLLTFRPVMTYLSKDQEYCRQYDVRSATERSAAVACRNQAGTWQIVMQLPPYPNFAPADSGREALDGYVESKRSGAPLGSEQVDQLVASHWQSRR